MAIRTLIGRCLLLGLLCLGGCREAPTGPVTVSAIGDPPEVVNPNLEPLDPPRALLLQAVAQGLVRFDAAGEIEPALAQSWIVSDDGLRYTFRLRRTEWLGGGRVTAEQVAARLRAAISTASRNALKPTLGLVEDVTPMTDEVLEITLRSARPNFLQLLAQPEMAILRNGEGVGPYRAHDRAGAVLLALPEPDDEAEEWVETAPDPPILLRGERAALAIARFAAGEADLVLGGTAGDLPIARAAQPRAASLLFDPVAGLFGLAFARIDGPLEDPAVRRALSMAIDRQSLVGRLAVPNLQARETLLPPQLEELPEPAAPDWTGAPQAMRRELAARIVAEASPDEPLRLRVAMPEGIGYRLVFAHLRRDWSAIGVDAVMAEPGAPADLVFIDAVAPATMAGWYLRHFACDRSPVCDPAADAALEALRTPLPAPQRQQLIAQADRLLTDAVAFIPVAAPVRWSLVSPRLTGFRPNMFAHHPPSDYIARQP